MQNLSEEKSRQPATIETLRAQLGQAIYVTDTARTQAEWDKACENMNKQLDALAELGLDRNDEYALACRAAKVLAATGGATIQNPQIALISDTQGVCLEGKWRGWLFHKHHDGNWVSQRKLDLVDPLAGSPLDHLFAGAALSKAEGR